MAPVPRTYCPNDTENQADSLTAVHTKSPGQKGTGAKLTTSVRENRGKLTDALFRPNAQRVSMRSLSEIGASLPPLRPSPPRPHASPLVPQAQLLQGREVEQRWHARRRIALDKARRIFERTTQHRPTIRLTIRCGCWTNGHGTKRCFDAEKTPLTAVEVSPSP
jgi:hypothetical protein